MRTPCLRTRFLSSFAAFVCVASLWMAPAARAGMIPDPIEAIGTSGLIARFLFVGIASGLPAGGIVLDGSVGAGDPTLLFTVEYLAASNAAVPQVAVNRLGGGSIPAVGWVPGAATNWTAGVLPLSNLAFAQAAALAPGDATDVFFVAVPGLGVGESFEFVFSASGVGSGTGNAQWVPEPTTLALVGGGLALLARRRPMPPKKEGGDS
jgi:hypothetical protein